MTTNPVDAVIEESIEETIQSEPTKEVFSGGISLVTWMARAGLYISPWWSPSRDRDLRRFWKETDHLAGAMYAMESKMTAIPFRIVAKNTSNKQHVLEGEVLTELLYEASHFGDGWDSMYGKWVNDLVGQDNGAFIEVIGEGDKAGPILGMPVSVAHLDSWRCSRTGNATWPVVYQDIDGRRFKLHYSRVMLKSQMPSPIAEMYGVGFCSISRCINVAQNLQDLLVHKQEKLGSRPHRAIVITKGGLGPADIRKAFQIAENKTDTLGLTRYSKVVVAGDPSMPEAGVDMLELTSLPDGFDEETSVILGMATIALAFGVDARELFPAMQSGATRADALLQHIKQRGKAPGQIIMQTRQMFKHKFLARHLDMVFDFQDDAQDRQVADIKKVRADRRLQDLNSGSNTVRVTREQMLEEGDMSRDQFEKAELTDGRLPDGSPILSLFFSEDKVIKGFLDLGVSDPLDAESQVEEAMMTLIRERIADVMKALVNAKTDIEKFPAYQALMALAYLMKYYQDPDNVDLLLGLSGTAPMVGKMPDQRQRKIDLTSPTDRDTDADDDLEEHPDDKE